MQKLLQESKYYYWKFYIKGIERLKADKTSKEYDVFWLPIDLVIVWRSGYIEATYNVSIFHLAIIVLLLEDWASTFRVVLLEIIYNSLYKI